MDSITPMQEAHESVREEIALLKSIIPLIGSEGGWSGKKKELIESITKGIPLHFAVEEEIMATMTRDNTLVARDAAVVARIREEHGEMLAAIHELATLSRGGGETGKEQRERFVEILNDLIEDLLEHARMEDNELLPIVRRLMGSEQVAAIFEAIMKGKNT